MIMAILVDCATDLFIGSAVVVADVSRTVSFRVAIVGVANAGIGLVEEGVI